MSPTTPDSASDLMKRTRFGSFMAPIHWHTSSVSRDLAHDLDNVVLLEDLGYDEVLFGEHHSSGLEIYGSPEIMIAAAASRTSRIKLGTGVTSLPYHHPFHVADRIAQLDHLTNGRLVFGVGPGALPEDSAMMGFPYVESRLRMEQSMDAIMHLFTSDEPLTVDHGWFKLENAVLNYKTFQRPHPPMMVASVASPNAPRIAGKFGLPLLSFGGLHNANRDVVKGHLDIMAQRSAEFGVTPAPRDAWRIVGPMHIARTRAQAEHDVEYGLVNWMKYFFRSPASWTSLESNGEPLKASASPVEIIRDTGFGVIGTPEDAVNHLTKLHESLGGFGTFLLQQHDWASPEATRESYRLFADQVIPHFQDELTRRSERWSYMESTFDDTVSGQRSGLEEALARHQAEYRVETAQR